MDEVKKQACEHGWSNANAYHCPKCAPAPSCGATGETGGRTPKPNRRDLLRLAAGLIVECGYTSDPRLAGLKAVSIYDLPKGNSEGKYPHPRRLTIAECESIIAKYYARLRAVPDPRTPTQ